MVSVVVAACNGKEYIEKQLESINNQTKKADEVIICDDSSTDETYAIIRQFIANSGLNNWKCFKNTKNVGYYENFINLVKMASGDTIYFSDQDDIWDLKKIECFENEFAQNLNIMMIQSNYCLIDEKDKIINFNTKYHGNSKKEVVNICTKEMCRFAGSGFTMAFKKEVKEFVFNNRLETMSEIFEFHDILFGLASISLGKVRMCRNIVDKHRLHNNNSTQKKMKNYAAGRSIDKQIANVCKRKKRIAKLLELNILKDNTKKTFMNYEKFNSNREKWLTKHNIFSFIYIFLNINFYNCKRVILADFLYGIGMEKLVIKLSI